MRCFAGEKADEPMLRAPMARGCACARVLLDGDSPAGSTDDDETAVTCARRNADALFGLPARLVELMAGLPTETERAKAIARLGRPDPTAVRPVDTLEADPSRGDAARGDSSVGDTIVGRRRSADWRNRTTLAARMTPEPSLVTEREPVAVLPEDIGDADADRLANARSLVPRRGPRTVPGARAADR
jgi:hypothetical protein